MPTYMLDGTSKATLPRRPVTVMINVEGDRGGVQLQALRDGVPDASAVVPQPSLMVLPRVEGRTVVRVVPAFDQQMFPTPTIVHVTLGVDSRSDVDAERAVLTGVDVSGLTHWDLASIELAGERLVVSSMKMAADVRLGELASQARVSARRLIGADERLAERAVDIVLAVDASASMARLIADGTVQAVLELLTGVADVVAAGREIRVCLLADSVRWLPVVPSAELGETTVRALHELGLTTGFRSTAVPDPVTATLTYVITDGVPADLPAMEAANAVPGDAHHLVSLIAPAAWAVQHVRSAVPATQVAPPPHGLTATEALLGAPGAIEAVVRALLVNGHPTVASV